MTENISYHLIRTQIYLQVAISTLNRNPKQINYSKYRKMYLVLFIPLMIHFIYKFYIFDDSRDFLDYMALTGFEAFALWITTTHLFVLHVFLFVDFLKDDFRENDSSKGIRKNLENIDKIALKPQMSINKIFKLCISYKSNAKKLIDENNLQTIFEDDLHFWYDFLFHENKTNTEDFECIVCFCEEDKYKTKVKYNCKCLKNKVCNFCFFNIIRYSEDSNTFKCPICPDKFKFNDYKKNLNLDKKYIYII